VTNLSPPAPLGTDNLTVVGTNWNFFFQDDYRVTSRLTINLGLRYEIPTNYHSVDNIGWNFDPANGGSISWVKQSFVNSVEEQAAAEGLTVYKPYLNCCVPNTLVPIDKKDFAPRIGVAWRPLNTDRFVVRAGYGIFYDSYMRYYELVQNFDSNALQTTFANSNYQSGRGEETTSPEPPLRNLWRTTISGAQYFSTTQPWNPKAFTRPILNQVNWPQNHNPYNQQWTLDTQFAMRPDMLLDIGYVGQHGLREPTYLPFNTAVAPKVPNDPCNYLSISRKQREATLPAPAIQISSRSTRKFLIQTCRRISTRTRTSWGVITTRCTHKCGRGSRTGSHTWFRTHGPEPLTNCRA
jgi:hypothetical protein